MKKLMLIAAAFATLVSCTKTQVIPTETAQQEISMKAYNQAAVKTTGPVISGYLPTENVSMSVSAFYANSGNDYEEYFVNEKFMHSGEKNWHGETTKYWPSTGKMKFIAIYPNEYKKDTGGKIECTFENKNTTPTTPTTTVISKIDLTGWSSDSNTNTQTDIMYSNNLYCGSAFIQCPSASSNNLLFQHLLSQIAGVTVTFGQNSTITSVTEIKLNNVGTKGDITIKEQNTTNISYIVSEYSNFTIYENGTANNADVVTNVLAIPTVNSDVTKKPSITLIYKIDDNSIEHTIDIGEIEQGKKYVYNISVNMNEITFTATAATWGDAIVNNL